MLKFIFTLRRVIESSEKQVFDTKIKIIKQFSKVDFHKSTFTIIYYSISISRLKPYFSR